MTEEKEYVTLELSENPSINDICNIFDEATKTVNVSSLLLRRKWRCYVCIC